MYAEVLGYGVGCLYTEPARLAVATLLFPPANQAPPAKPSGTSSSFACSSSGIPRRGWFCSPVSFPLFLSCREAPSSEEFWSPASFASSVVLLRVALLRVFFFSHAVLVALPTGCRHADEGQSCFSPSNFPDLSPAGLLLAGFPRVGPSADVSCRGSVDGAYFPSCSPFTGREGNCIEDACLCTPLCAAVLSTDGGLWRVYVCQQRS